MIMKSIMKSITGRKSRPTTRTFIPEMVSQGASLFLREYHRHSAWQIA